MQISFRPNDEFDEAALYTTDVWLREEDFDEDTPAPLYAPTVTTEHISSFPSKDIVEFVLVFCTSQPSPPHVLY
jgi:hypothetical protein